MNPHRQGEHCQDPGYRERGGEHLPGSGWAVGESLPFPIRDRANTSPSTNSARISSMTQSTLLPGLNIGDAQDLPNLWGDLPSPRAMLTSPPYLDIHDYGNASRIGARGQALDEYLVQMLKLFSGCYRIASADATLWLVAGAIRRNKRLIMLPDRLASCAEEAGWKRERCVWTPRGTHSRRSSATNSRS